ncbi:Gfo/Idh/MocA family oxidoreductase [Streptomyces sp. XM4193]|uniref:Gfo/Idh/MocA family protein n=1 Tax=Streptomyces sp. XM4193 TaxID=2929782 RepID=UPI001FFABE7B|nr:Gfo/Idh/MocA family oxidoreductase [Streptomyces sp. XM4193]MCK1798083.1 Gfo/Idh/MocA family oxidoreductase [Streptomyces sp. XM4193]
MSGGRPELPFRVGVIGAGIVGTEHVRALAESTDCEPAAVCDIDRAAAARLAAPFGVPVHTDHREMFARSGLDAVVVTSPHALHAPMVLDAAEAGLHVLVEKPMATTAEDCTRMIEACRRAGTLLAVAHVIHFDPMVREARRLIDSGEYGAPLLVTHQRSSHYDPGSRPAWFFDRALAGGGIVLNVGTHGLDRIQLFGGAPVRRVSAIVRGRPGMEVETDALALLELANGVGANLTLTSRGAPYLDETEVVMETATLRLSRTNGLALLRDGKTVDVCSPDLSQTLSAFRAQLEGFAAAARGRPGQYCDGPYGRSVVSAALAVYDSARLGGPVEMSDEQVVLP